MAIGSGVLLAKLLLEVQFESDRKAILNSYFGLALLTIKKALSILIYLRLRKKNDTHKRKSIK